MFNKNSNAVILIVVNTAQAIINKTKLNRICLLEINQIPNRLDERFKKTSFLKKFKQYDLFNSIKKYFIKNIEVLNT